MGDMLDFIVMSTSDAQEPFQWAPEVDLEEAAASDSARRPAPCERSRPIRRSTTACSQGAVTLGEIRPGPAADQRVDIRQLSTTSAH